jgi:acyl transferase domain-containing protein
MLGVPLPEDELVTMLGDRDLLAAVNAPGQCTVSGSSEDMEKLFDELNKKGIECRNLHTSHAFHSYMMEPILEQFKLLVEKIKLNEPAIPYISCVSGTWITGRECKDPAYWADHIRKTVRFSQGVSEILKDESAVLLEVGPGQTLCSLAKRNNTNTGERTVLAAMRHPNSRLSDGEVLLSALGKLWIAGVKIDWDGYYSGEKRKRIHLPTYPFQRKRYWIEGKKTAFDSATTGEKGVKDWFHTLVWKRQDRIGTLELTTVKEQRKTWLLFEDKCGISAQLAARLKECGQDVICVAAGEGFSIDGKDKFTIHPLKRQDYERLIEELEMKIKRQTVSYISGITMRATLKNIPEQSSMVFISY